MKKLQFEVYVINRMFQGQADSVTAVVIPKFYMPKGRCKLDGSSMQNEDKICFDRLYDVGTYFSDWIDMLENEELIQAKIFLNNLSLYKVFVGQKIIEIIDKIEKLPKFDRMKLRSFNEVT